MPSGKTHAAATTLAAITVPILLDPASPEGMVSGCLLGLLITPDLDVENKTRAHSTVAKVGREVGGKNGKMVGEVLSNLWYVFWWPYGKLFPHRSYWSHAPADWNLGPRVLCTRYVHAYLACDVLPSCRSLRAAGCSRVRQQTSFGSGYSFTYTAVMARKCSFPSGLGSPLF